MAVPPVLRVLDDPYEVLGPQLIVWAVLLDQALPCATRKRMRTGAIPYGRFSSCDLHIMHCSSPGPDPEAEERGSGKDFRARMQ